MASREDDLKIALAGIPQDWLMTLYKTRSDRMLSDNEGIWRTGNIFTPISLSAFAALLAIKDVKPCQVLTLGLASSALILCWVVIAENHRAFQQESEAWLDAIQETIGIKVKRSPKLWRGAFGRVFGRVLPVQRMRWLLAILVTVGWMLLYRQACLGHLW